MGKINLTLCDDRDSEDYPYLCVHGELKGVHNDQIEDWIQNDTTDPVLARARALLARFGISSLVAVNPPARWSKARLFLDGAFLYRERS